MKKMPTKKKIISKRKIVKKQPHCGNSKLSALKKKFNNVPASSIMNKGARFPAPLPKYRNAGLSSKERSFIICRCQTQSTRYMQLKEMALNCIQQRKIFTIYGYCSPVRKALFERGWIEKIPSYRMNLLKLKKRAFNTKPEINSELEKMFLSSLLNKYAPNFIWHAKEEHLHTYVDRANDNMTIENKLKVDTLWTTKQGLCLCIKRNYWFYIEDVSDVTAPRSYNTSDSAEVDDFDSDFKITACTSLLKWMLSMVSNNKLVFAESGQIPINILLFALNRCKEYLFRKQNRDIDRQLSDISSTEWDTFLTKYYRLIERKDIFHTDTASNINLYLGFSKFFLEEIARYRPQGSCEGFHNIWIIKPAHNSRGRGIRLTSKLQIIMDTIKKAYCKYVIQKYIEEPLLIYDTKFDIRQYYLVTSTYPLIIWMYEDCYLKFSSQKYNLRNFHESIHLTNNAVQKKYTNSSERHPALPASNMWDSDMYKDYLKSIGKHKVWDNIIYPGMRKSIIGVMLSCQDSLSISKNRFELYGCDFILDKMYTPWLIEINSNPDLTNTTPVTAKICPAVLADIIKVIIDYPFDENISTGKFECIYRQPMTTPRYGPAVDMCVRGYPLPYNYFYQGDVPLPKCVNDIIDINKTNNFQNLLENIKVYFNRNTLTADIEQDCETNKADTSNDFNSESTIITAQLEMLLKDINSLVSENRTLSAIQSMNSVTKIESALKRSISRLASLVVVSLKQKEQDTITSIQEGNGSPKHIDSAIGEVNIIRTILDSYNVAQKEVRELFRNQNNTTIFTSPNKLSNISNSKNIIIEATTDIVSFIKKKEKEYLGNELLGTF